MRAGFLNGFWHLMAPTTRQQLPMDFDSFQKAIISPALRDIAAHWAEAREGALMPSWAQLRPSRMARHLSIVWAFRYDRAKDRFFGRLAGGKFAWVFDKSFRSMPLEEAWPPQSASRSHQLMHRLVTEPRVLRSAGGLFRYAGRAFEGERLALPLASDGFHGDGVLGATVYDYPLPVPNQGPIELLLDDIEWSSLPAPSDTAN